MNLHFLFFIDRTQPERTGLSSEVQSSGGYGVLQGPRIVFQVIESELRQDFGHRKKYSRQKQWTIEQITWSSSHPSPPTRTSSVHPPLTCGVRTRRGTSNKRVLLETHLSPTPMFREELDCVLFGRVFLTFVRGLITQTNLDKGTNP